MDWTKEATKVLIQLYEENDLLYNSLNENYKNRQKRLETIVKIAQHISAVSGQMCLVMDVRKKINGLRSQYHMEKLKIAKSKSGSGQNEYIPSAYWFPLLKFLDVPNSSEDCRSSLDESNVNENSLISKDTARKLRNHCKKNDTTVNSFAEKNRKATNENETAEDNKDTLLQEATQIMREMSEEIKQKRHLLDPVINPFAEKKTKYANENYTDDNGEATHPIRVKTEEIKRERNLPDPVINSFTEFLANELQELSDSDRRIYLKAKREIHKVICDAWDSWLTDPLFTKETPSCSANSGRNYKTNVLHPAAATNNQKRKFGCSFLRKHSNSDSQDGSESDLDRFLIRHDLCNCAKHRGRHQDSPRGSASRHD